MNNFMIIYLNNFMNIFMDVKGVPKKVSDSNFVFQVGIIEYLYFPNLFLIIVYISTTLTLSIFELEQFSFVKNRSDFGQKSIGTILKVLSLG